ncbi:protein of unknown function [Ruminococcaceae bacterium BL-6]|nr:protein of unknown function [Ruminococcaceae bacterium BL-6]
MKLRAGKKGASGEKRERLTREKAEKSRRLSEPAAFEMVEGDYKKFRFKKLNLK